MPVCIAGMHRSGTSMVTKLLHESGLYLGPDEDLMPPAEENPEGFWEHLGFVELNEEVLNQLGGGWDCPPPLPADWTGGRLAPLAARAEALVAPFDGREPWGWKDPRNSLTLPFWQAILGRVRTVIVVRNPLEVARSLRERNGFSYALGLTLWQISYQRLLDATAPADRVVTHYDAYFGTPEVELRRVLALLEMPVDEAVIEQFRAGPTSGLRHHRFSLQDLLDAGVSPEVLALYRTLCEEAEWRDGDAVRLPFGSDAAPGTGAASPLEIGVGRVNRVTVEMSVELAVLRPELEEHRRVRREHERQILQLEERREREVTERDDRIHELDVALHEREIALREEMREHEVMERELVALRQTVGDQAAHLDVLGVHLDAMRKHEDELRTMLVGAHEQLLHRDAEVMATLGAALARHAPGAPSAVYYRQLVAKVRGLVAERLPPKVPVLVVSWGDDAMLHLDGREAWHFPLPQTGVGANYLPIDGSAAIAQLQLSRSRGAGFLVVPASGEAWLARHPELEAYLEQRYPAVVREANVCTVYALTEPDGDGSGRRADDQGRASAITTGTGEGRDGS